MAIDIKDKLVTVEALAEVYNALTTVLNRIGASNLNSNPSMLVNLESTSAANVMQTSPRPGVTGMLPISNGGTGAGSAAQAKTNLGLGNLNQNLRFSASNTAGQMGMLVWTVDNPNDTMNGGSVSLVAENNGVGLWSSKDGNTGWLFNLTVPVSVANGGTGANNAASARTNLGITPANIGAAAESYIAARLFSVRGEIVNSGTTGTTIGYGKATVAITGKTAIITYIAKIVTAGTLSDVFDVGISVATLRSINPDIPAMTPLNGGNIQYYTADGELDTRMTGFGGECTVNTTTNRWNFARLYTTSGGIGTWADNTYTTDKIVTGILYGRIS